MLSLRDQCERAHGVDEFVKFDAFDEKLLLNTK